MYSREKGVKTQDWEKEEKKMSLEQMELLRDQITKDMRDPTTVNGEIAVRYMLALGIIEGKIAEERRKRFLRPKGE